ncbi:MAG: metallophosphoesterase family protein [Pseudomonadota bacterium]
MRPRIPDGEVTYAIGDTHGRSDLLSQLLEQIQHDAQKADAPTKTLIFLGDYVDRGPDSRGVIDILSGGLPDGFGAIFLKGNHEQLMLDFLADASWLGPWCRNGGEQTLRSYGVNFDRLEHDRAPPDMFREEFARALPARHLAFFNALKLYHVVGDYAFVHAGLRPGVALEAQSPNDLIWIRGPFLDALDPFEKMVVHGHTPEAEPVIRAHRIGIDTGAVFSGRLTAVRLFQEGQEFLQTAV